MTYISKIHHILFSINLIGNKFFAFVLLLGIFIVSVYCRSSWDKVQIYSDLYEQCNPARGNDVY